MDTKSRIVGFVHYLRESGFKVSQEQSKLIGQSLSALAIPDRDLSGIICRAICCQRDDEWNRFQALFDHYWSEQKTQSSPDVERPGELGKVNNGSGLSGISGGSDNEIGWHDDTDSATSGAGRQSTITKADFRFLRDSAAMRKIESLTDRLALRIRPRPGRRRVLDRKSGQLAIAQTLRASIKTGGFPAPPWYAKRRPEPPRLIILHDVSHSMTFNNPLLFRFTRGLVKHFKHSQAFVFHTRLYPVTSILRNSSVIRIQQKLEANNRMWFGGTCIADSLNEFIESYGSSTIKSDSIVIIISDGIDSNQPEQLAQALQAISKRCKRIHWLNPMLERDGFNAEKDAIKNIRCNVNSLLPAHSLGALQRCVKALSSRA